MALSSTSPSTGTAGEDTDAFRFSDLLRVAGERLALILVTATVVVAAAIIGVMLWPSTYSGIATVMLEPRVNNITQFSSPLAAQPTDPASVQNQIQILESRDLAARVIADLKLYEDPEFAKPDMFTGQYPSADGVIDNFERHLTVSAVGLSTAFTITFKANNPDKAAKIANAIADAYLADQVSYENQAASTTTTWLLERVHSLARQVQNAEAAAQQYRADNNINDTSAGLSLLDQQLIAQSTALVSAQSDLAGRQAVAGHINSMIASGQGADVSQVVSSPLMVQLRQQETDLIRQEATLATKYGPRHPKMIDIESQKQTLEDKIAQEAARIGGSAANDVTVAKANAGSIAGNLHALEKRETKEGLARVKLKALEANAASTRDMYQAFVTRLREVQGAVALPDSRILSRAAIPSQPSSPQRTMIVGAAIPVGLLIGLLFALIAERGAPARTRYYEAPSRDLRPGYAPQPAVAMAAPDALHGATVLGDIPDYAALRAADIVVDRPGDAYARSVDALVSRVTPAARGMGGKIIAVTSPDANEGRTALATALARAATQRGLRAIVIDSDFASPHVAAAMGLYPGYEGLQDVLAGRTALSDILARDTRSAALLLSPAREQQGTPFLNALPQVIAYLKRSFDLVILDCPPPAYASASRAFLPQADAAVLLVRWQSTPRAAVTQTIDTLRALRVPATGVVFAR